MAGYDGGWYDASGQSTYLPPQAQGVPPGRQASPLDGTVHEEFHKAAQCSGLSDEVISQIAEQVRTQVIDSLKAEGLAYKAPYESVSPSASRQPPLNQLPRRETNPSPPSANEDTASLRPETSYRRKEDLDGRRGERTLFSTEGPVPDQVRPEPRRKLTAEEETTLEKIWGPLFDSNGTPTARFEQFLRGIALHLIEDYEPHMSLVIGPSKMLRFYQDVSLQNELYPWSLIFGGLDDSSIGKIYYDLRCEHHLIQGSKSDVPSIPALTPHGFETWMTLMVQAHTDLEFERLAKALVKFPISNADDRKERLPKELSRRLLPREANFQARQRCVAAISAHARVTIDGSVQFPPPPPTQPPASHGAAQDHTDSRYATTQPYRTDLPPPNGPPSQAVVSEDDEDPPTISFRERERKPYVAKEGSGKFHDGSNAAVSGTTETTRSYPRPSSHPATLPTPTHDRRVFPPPTTLPHQPPSSATFPTRHLSGTTEPLLSSTTRTRHSTSGTHPYHASTAPINTPQTETPFSSSSNVPAAATTKNRYGTSPSGMGVEPGLEFRGRSRASSGSKLGDSGCTSRSSAGSHYTNVSSGSAASEKRGQSTGGNTGGRVSGWYANSGVPSREVPAGYPQGNLYADTGEITVGGRSAERDRDCKPDRGRDRKRDRYQDRDGGRERARERERTSGYYDDPNRI